MTDIKKRLAEDLAEVEWERLRPHFERGGLILVSPELDLLEAAVAVATDESERVRGWLEELLLTKPDESLIAKWDEEPKALFSTLIVQPFVLFKEVTKES